MRTKLLVFLVGMMLFGSVGVKATEMTLDGLTYTLSDDSGLTAEVKSFDKSTTTVVIPESISFEGRAYKVTSIGESAFDFCRGLTSVTFPSGLESIGECAFRYCVDLTSPVFPSGLKSIEKLAFAYCNGLTFVSLPSSLTSIGSTAFACCLGLTKFIVSTDNTAYSSIDGILFNKEGTTLVCYPNAKQSTYTIPNGVTSIGECAFNGCEGLTSITFPSGLTSIELGAFIYCRGLTSLTLPSGLTSIEDKTFWSCGGLTSITLPVGITSIGKSTFYYCPSLTSIHCTAPVPPKIFIDTFQFEISLDRNLYVPVGSKTAYMAADHWKYFKNIIEEAGLGTDELPQTALISYGDGILTLPNTGTPATVEVYTIEGKQTSSYQVSNGSCDLNSLPSGIYIIKVKVGEKVMSRKIMK